MEGDNRPEALGAGSFPLEATLEALRIGFWSFDAASGQVWWSPEVYRLHGLERGTPVHSLTTFEIMHPDDRERVARTISAVAADPKAFAYQYRVLLPNHDIRRLDVKASPILQDGALAGMRGVTQEARPKSAEESSWLEDARRLSERVGALSPDLVIIYDTTKDLFVYGNRVAATFFGVAASDLQTLDWTRYVHPDDVAVLTAGFHTSRVGDVPLEQQLRVRRADGEWRHLRSRTIALGARSDGTPLWTLTVAEDVSDQLALFEATRAAKEAAEQAMRARSEFLASASHELRTPLSAILGYADGLIEGVAGDLSVRQRGYVQEIQAAGSVLLRLVTDLLELSRAEAHRWVLNKVPVPADELIAGSVGLVAEMARRKRIQLRSEVAPDVGTIDVDPIRMRQVLWNLLANAVKFTPEGGCVEVRVERSFCVGRSAVTITITDTGIGIDDALQHKLFQPFARLHSSTQFPGTGLGLAIVRRFVELHGGQVTVRSQLARGSRFAVTIPQPAARSA